MKIGKTILINLTNNSKRVLDKTSTLSTLIKRKIKRITDKTAPTLSPEEIIAGLNGFCEKIKESSDNAAAPFLKLGGELQTIYSSTTDLTKKTFSSVEMISGKTDDSVIVKIDTIVKHAISEIENFKSTITVKLELITEIVEFLESLNRKCFALERISLFLQVVGLNIGVECTRSSEAVDMFTLVADEITQLALKIRTLSKDMAEDVEDALKTQTSAHEQLTMDFYNSMELAHGVKYAVQDAADDIEKLMSLSLNTLEDAGGHSKAISQQIGEIVMGIQFHDNMAQRIEHIITAVNDVTDLCSKNVDSNDAKPIKERCALAHSILSIQIAQLKQIIHEIDTVYQKNTSSFDEIIIQTDMIVRSLLTISSGGEKKKLSLSATEAKDPFSNLTEILKEIQSLLWKRDEIIEHLAGISEHASKMASKLETHTGTVHKISYEAHMMALNAIVKAAQIGDMGTTLEILAQEVRILSGQSDTFVKDVDCIIKPVTIAAQKLHGNDTEAKTTFSISESIEDITSTYKKFTTDSNDALELSEQIKNDISRVRNEMNFLPELARELKDFQKNLTSLSDNITNLKGEGDISSDLASLSDRYTMQEERAIHEQISTGASAENIQISESNEPTGEVELFDIGDNSTSEDMGGVELFDTEENTISEDMNLENVELFDSDGTEARPEKKKDDDEDLGDNIELF